MTQPLRGGGFMKRTFKGACLMGIAWASMFATAQAGEVDWAALNPAFAKAAYVKDKEACVSCHADSIEAYKKTVHGRTFQYGRSEEHTSELQSQFHLLCRLL